MRFTIGPAGLGYLLVSGLIAATAFYTQINLLFWALGLMIAGMIVSVIGSWLMMRKLEVSRILPDHGVAGEQTILRYRVVNHSHWIPVFGLTIKETWGRGRRGWKREGPITEDPPRLDGRPHGWLMHLGPGQVLQAQAPCWPLRRGELTFERLVLSCSFPFGVVGREASFQRPGSLLVYPHLYRVNRKLIHQISNMDPVGHQRLERGGGHEEFFGLRQYRL
ncbi:MAG: hypothetical protein R3336_00130, partial [Phycisphaeraceae bacterium]|nr:hypothetical protein [Phycisphaeraceae bacterium]